MQLPRNRKDTRAANSRIQERKERKEQSGVEKRFGVKSYFPAMVYPEHRKPRCYPVLRV